MDENSRLLYRNFGTDFNIHIYIDHIYPVFQSVGFSNMRVLLNYLRLCDAVGDKC
jgi:hypothetical protein